jgi:hypothetical protein
MKKIFFVLMLFAIIGTCEAQKKPKVSTDTCITPTAFIEEAIRDKLNSLRVRIESGVKYPDLTAADLGMSKEITQENEKGCDKMNPINYATLEQSKRMKELGYPQDKTDCVWIKIFIGEPHWILVPRMGCNLIKSEYFMESNDGDYDQILEWHSAPNAQEIELDIQCAGVLYFVGNAHSGKWCPIYFGKIHHAQTRADAWIWEMENK